MGNEQQGASTKQARWARFRFSIVGPLLSAPPKSGELKRALDELSKKYWRHPITGVSTKFGASTIERWLYKARLEQDPLSALHPKRRADAGQVREMSPELQTVLQKQYRAHPGWSYQLHRDNLAIDLKNAAGSETMPSYSTVRRYMKANGLFKRSATKEHHTPGAIVAAARLEDREVRSFEMDHVHGLWHLDFHHGSRKILNKDGTWKKPLLLVVMDDRSRVLCHAQWYLNETAESLVHGFMQALQKRALPRALMNDNGSAMISAEFEEGLERLGILYQRTLPLSPYQNGKNESLWGQVEGRLMAMLEGEPNLTLKLLNEATIAWVEFEYHHKIHSELDETPMQRYLKGPDVGRPCPTTAVLRHAFCTQVKRKQRRSDGTFSLHSQRFEIPSQYRHFEHVYLRYARWDLSYVTLVDPHSNAILGKLYPLDKSANSDGQRRRLQKPDNQIMTPVPESSGIAPLLKNLMSQYAATGLPPAYIPTENHDE